MRLCSLSMRIKFRLVPGFGVHNHIEYHGDVALIMPIILFKL